jgi:hypothetical protein
MAGVKAEDEPWETSLAVGHSVGENLNPWSALTPSILSANTTRMIFILFSQLNTWPPVLSTWSNPPPAPCQRLVHQRLLLLPVA